MASAGAASQSKLRRNRALATKQKLYDNSKTLDPILILQSQVLSLTSAINQMQLLLCGAVVQVPCFLPQYQVVPQTMYETVNCKTSWADEQDVVCVPPDGEKAESAARAIQQAYRIWHKRSNHPKISAGVCSQSSSCSEVHESAGSNGSEAESDDCPDEELQVVRMSMEEFKAKFYPLMSYACIRKYHMCGMRDYEDRVWYQIDDSEDSVVAERQQPELSLSVDMRAETEKAVAQYRVVESRLDYMVRYCELAQQGPSPQATALQSPILTMVRDSQAWLKQKRSACELGDKIQELDTFMEDLLRA